MRFATLRATAASRDPRGRRPCWVAVVLPTKSRSDIMADSVRQSSLAHDPRFIRLEAGFNLRDFGGYPAADGRRVKLGALFRSGTMGMLTEQDEARLRGLGIRGICDFRRQNERAAEPTTWHRPVGVAYWARNYDQVSGILSEIMKDTQATPEHMHEAMVALYREIPRDHAPSYSAMFRQIAEGGVPLLINCSAGKDRTGVAAALILTVLGVSREDIEHDYLATNTHADWPRLLSQRGNLVSRTWQRDPAMMAPLLRAETEYLTAAFDELDAGWGGVEGYLGSLGVDAATLGKVREQLLD
jgi:protein-tyrosine phosphatase